MFTHGPDNGTDLVPPCCGGETRIVGDSFALESHAGYGPGSGASHLLGGRFGGPVSRNRKGGYCFVAPVLGRCCLPVRVLLERCAADVRNLFSLYS